MSEAFPVTRFASGFQIAVDWITARSAVSVVMPEPCWKDLQLSMHIENNQD